MRVMWVSNAPWVPSGYGVQTQIFSNMLKQAGHDVTIFGFHGHQGAVMSANGIEVLPSSLDGWGSDMMAGHWAHYRPDVTVLLIDIWVYPPQLLSQLPITSYAPIDHQPIAIPVKRNLERCRHTWAMSRHGEREMRRAGFDPYYVPHGVHTQMYAPKDRQKSRQIMQVKDDTFLAIMVAANKGLIMRKSFDKVFKAWAKFVETHDDSLLYVHALPQTGGRDDADLKDLAEFYGISEKHIRFPNSYRLLRGDYHPGFMNAIYNAADVLVSPSMGEGFGVPVVEAQSAGCPVIVSDFSAQSELCFGGYKVKIDPFDDVWYTPQVSEQCFPRPSEVLKGFEWGYEHRGDMKLRDEARKGALDYDAKRVFDTYMLPALENIALMDHDAIGRRPEAVDNAVDIEFESAAD